MIDPDYKLPEKENFRALKFNVFFIKRFFFKLNKTLFEIETKYLG